MGPNDEGYESDWHMPDHDMFEKIKLTQTVRTVGIQVDKPFKRTTESQTGSKS